MIQLKLWIMEAAVIFGLSIAALAIKGLENNRQSTITLHRRVEMCNDLKNCNNINTTARNERKAREAD